MEGKYILQCFKSLLEENKTKLKIFIQLRDKETGKISNKVKLEDIIYNQSEIEFKFGDETLTYKDFLFYRNDYEIIKIVEY